jgi:hypothetical protein
MNYYSKPRVQPVPSFSNLKNECLNLQISLFVCLEPESRIIKNIPVPLKDLKHSRGFRLFKRLEVESATNTDYEIDADILRRSLRRTLHAMKACYEGMLWRHAMEACYGGMLWRHGLEAWFGGMI